MTYKEKFMTLVSVEETNTVERNKERVKNRAMLRASQQIALKVLMKLDELDWSQKRLAEAMGVSPQQVNKILKGKENLTLETQVKLQDILNVPILADYYENQFKALNEFILTFTGEENYELSDEGDSYYTVNSLKVSYKNNKVYSTECSFEEVI